MRKKRKNSFHEIGWISRKVEDEVLKASIAQDERAFELWKQKYGELEYDELNVDHRENWYRFLDLAAEEWEAEQKVREQAGKEPWFEEEDAC